VFRLFLCVVLFSLNLIAQSSVYPIRPPMPDSLFLSVQRPDKDTIKTILSRYRIAACTRPEAKAFINGKQVRVYPSGAFVNLVELKFGINIIHFTVKSVTDDSLWKDFIVIRQEPLKNSPRDTIVIEQALMEPAEDMWLTSGDILEVKFKGSPGWEASFDIPDVESGIPMKELSANENGGLAGIYIGRYKIKSTDEVKDIQVTFRLKKSFWSKEKTTSSAKISILNKDIPRVAEVIGKRPFLNVGLGEDRLGGARLGFISTGTIIEINGKIGTQYRVHLSDQMVAWISEEFVKLLPLNTHLPKSLSGAISVTSNDKDDIVTLVLDNKLPYISDQLINPNAIVVDVYGATSNTNWISQPLTSKGIESVTWKQVSDNQYRMIINLKYRQHWGYDIDYVGSSLRVKIRRPPVILSQDSILSSVTIGLDAGHGGENSGAFGATGVREKDVTMAITRQLENILLSKGARVVLTRSESNGSSNYERIDKILNSRPNILVSIHCNSAGDASDPSVIRGTSAYYRPIGFKPLADIVYEKVLTTGLKPFGLVGSFNSALNSLTQVPNVLIETAYVSNPEDEMLLLDEGFRKKLAEQIVTGLEEYLKLNTEPKISNK
jgi:N-acetylmuramoyl-L-alanine amidase